MREDGTEIKSIIPPIISDHFSFAFWSSWKFCDFYRFGALNLNFSCTWSDDRHNCPEVAAWRERVGTVLGWDADRNLASRHCVFRQLQGRISKRVVSLEYIHELSCCLISWTALLLTDGIHRPLHGDIHMEAMKRDGVTSSSRCFVFSNANDIRDGASVCKIHPHQAFRCQKRAVSRSKWTPADSIAVESRA